MNRYEQTSIWQKALGKQLDPDPHEKERDILRVEFENFRQKAKLLASEIALVLPEYTVHDITHIDALWETAELVAKDDFALTPAEAFVLGGTFLIHDLGMGLASFPHGIEELKKEAIWKDSVASLLKEEFEIPLDEAEIIDFHHEVERIATESTLRILHAKHAEKLALVSWRNKEGQDVYLIDNAELRESYGTVIGVIAHSHWWTVEELEERLPKTLGAPGIFPSSWTIDAVKLACILRIADATQIDDRRAPSFLRTIRNLSSYSDLHWNFQQKLYQPRLERSRLVFTSKSPFSIAEVDSWWICHDTLQMIDNELKEVDSLLVDSNRQRLKAIGVASIEDPKRLSKLITVEGWQPVDTKIKVTNVAKLVNSLGGRQLYGDNLIVPLRELIQNASDAIRARRVLENEPLERGNIIIRLGNDEHGQFIEVEDNGVGMSPKVLTGPFLDFGQSFWGTELMHEELPGLESKGFTPTGKYGIGFFSVFMWGERVSVSSRRYEAGRDSTLILEFNEGASSRPILRKAKQDEVIKDGGTRVRVWLSRAGILESLLKRHGHVRHRVTTTELIQMLCPSIDCNITLEENGVAKQIIEANDWITIEPIKLIERLFGSSYYNDIDEAEKQVLENASKHMSLIKEDDGSIVGRLLLYKRLSTKQDSISLEGMITVGGMRASKLTGLLGIIVGKSDRASRDVGVPIVSASKLEDWASGQADLLSNLNLDTAIQIECAMFARACGGVASTLKIAYHKSIRVNYEQIKNIIKNSTDDTFLIIDGPPRRTDGKKYDHNFTINYFENVFLVDSNLPGIWQTGNNDQPITWPKYKNDWFDSRSLRGMVMIAFHEVWGNSYEELMKCVAERNGNAVAVGTLEGKPAIINSVCVFKRPN